MAPETNQPAQLTARELILALMDSTAAESLSARYLIAAGALFDMDAGSIRTALVRLVRSGVLTTSGRGRYAPGPKGDALKSLVRNWYRVEDALVPWSGHWLAVFVSHLGRSHKTRLRSNQRALKLLGFAEAETGLWVRPANFARTPAAVRSELLALGLDPQSRLALVEAFEPDSFVDPERLWDTSVLDHRYRDDTLMLQESLSRFGDLPLAAAARETLLIGREVTRHILLDPLLPDELVNAAARRTMIDTMRHYDRIGRRLWRAFYRRHEVPG